MAIYSNPDYENQWEKNYHIAKGLPSSAEQYKFWEISEPHKLMSLVNSKFTDINDRNQFKRVIRYLKRWKDFNFYSNTNGKPSGIAITALSYNYFSACTSLNISDFNYYYDDLKATKELVTRIIGQFKWNNQIEVKLPVRPYNNLFEKMTNNQMLDLNNQLSKLRDALVSATNDSTTNNACNTLQKVFGYDFPTF